MCTNVSVKLNYLAKNYNNISLAEPVKTANGHPDKQEATAAATDLFLCFYSLSTTSEYLHLTRLGQGRICNYSTKKTV